MREVRHTEGVNVPKMFLSVPLRSLFLGGHLSPIEGAVMAEGLTAIEAELFSIETLKDSVLQYETAIKSNQPLLVAQRTAEEAPLQARKATSASNSRSVDSQSLRNRSGC